MSAKNIKLRFRHGESECEQGDNKMRKSPADRFSKSMESLELILQNLEIIKTHPSWKNSLKESSSMMELRPATRKEPARANLLRKTLDTRDFPGTFSCQDNTSSNKDDAQKIIKKKRQKSSEAKKIRGNVYGSVSNLDDEVFVDSVMLRKERSFSSKSGTSSTGSHSEVTPPQPHPPSSDDVFMKKLDSDWEVYKARAGRIFYYNLNKGIATWKPPRHLKPLASPDKSQTETAMKSPMASSLKLPTEITLKSPTASSLKSPTETTLKSPTTNHLKISDAVDNPEKMVGRTSEEESDYEEMVRDSIRRSDEPKLWIPPGYAEYVDQTTGCIFYEDYVSEVRWYTALDPHGNLYFYTAEDEPRSEWTLPAVPSILDDRSPSSRKYEMSSYLIERPGQDVDKFVDKAPAQNKLDSGIGHSWKRGEICWKYEGNKKWQTSFALLQGNVLSFFKEHKEYQQKEEPLLKLDLQEAQVSWKKGKRKQIILQVFGASQIHIKADTGLDSWYKAIKKETLLLVGPENSQQNSPITTFSFSSLPSSPSAVSPTDTSPRASSPRAPSPSPASPSKISGPYNAHKASPEELLKLLSPQPLKETSGPVKNKLGRKGLSKSFRKMADNIVQKRVKPQDSLQTQSSKVMNRRSGVRREESRRSQYLSRFLKRRPTHDELKAQGIIKDSSVFGCALFHQKMTTESSSQVPEFLYKAIKKLEGDPENLVTTGIYRVPGDVAKVQKIRVEVDQESFLTFDKTEDVHVLAGCIKLFLRELPDPLIPYIHHKAFVRAAMGVGTHKQDVSRGLEELIDKLDAIEQDTLYFVVDHLSRVAKAENKMGMDNLGLLFGQVLLWPDPNAVLDMKLIAESAKNCQVAEALIKFSDNFSANSE